MATVEETTVTQRPLCQIETAQEPYNDLLPITGYENMPLVSLEKAVEPLVDLLPHIQEYVEEAKRHCQKPADGLTQDESASIMLYTMGWKPEKECLYFVLNSTLRSQERYLHPWFLYLKLFLNALLRLPPISCIVYRGIKSNLYEEYMTRKTLTWWGFSSCTTELKLLQEQFLGETGTRSMFMIDCKSGRDIHKHSYFKSEKEVLLLATTQFKIKDYLKQGDLQIIKLEEIHSPKISLRPIDPRSLVNNKSNSETKDSTFQYQNVTLKTKIADNKDSSTLDLESMELIDQDMKIVAHYAIRNSTTLTTLILDGNKIGPQGVQYLTDELKNNKSITKLSLQYNQIGDKGAQYFGILLQQNTTLTTLDLYKNQIGDRGVQYLCNGLQDNTSLSKLNLSANRLGALGVEQLCHLLRHNNTLTVLRLAFNIVGDQGSQYLRDTLRENKSLTTLDLEHTQIRAQGIQYLSDGLQQNTTLIRLIVRDNHFGERGLQCLDELKRRKKRLRICFQ